MFSRNGEGRGWKTAVLSGATVVVSLAVILVVLAGRAPGMQSVPERDSAGFVSQQSVDLRCLTRRPQDCLDEPVPADEPHGAVCATCHNLYDHRENPGTILACTESGCHEDPLSLSPFHNTVASESLEDCSHCHVAHEFRVDGDGGTCAACHSGGGQRVAWAGGRPLRHLAVPGVAFVHSDHPEVACETCHGEDRTHGTLTLQGAEDCRSCHHSAPVASDCAGCHSDADVAGLDLHLSRTLNIDIGSVVNPVRWLPFDHSLHTHTTCATCHTEGSTLAAGPGADCSTCHRDHHSPESDCSVCHARPVDGAHDRDVHMGCTGQGCHDAPEAISGAPRTRELCLVCHRDRVDHQVDRACADCHVLPEVRGETG